MRKNLGLRLIILFLFFLAISCNKFLVKVDDFDSEMGGKNTISTIQTFPVSIENKTITGIQKDATTTAVIFKDENNKLVTNYSNVNRIRMFHIEEWSLKNNFKNLNVSRQFYYYSFKTFILKIFFTIPTFGYIWALPHDFYFDEIPIYNKDHQLLGGYQFSDFFEQPGKSDYTVLITITNNGEIPIKDEFTVVDVLPNFLEFESVEYLSNGEIKELGYDLHKNENSQVIPFKIRPFKDGLQPREYLILKIHFKPNLQKFKVKSNVAN